MSKRAFNVCKAFLLTLVLLLIPLILLLSPLTRAAPLASPLILVLSYPLWLLLWLLPTVWLSLALIEAVGIPGLKTIICDVLDAYCHPWRDVPKEC
jgi:hypothetical protein